MSPKDDLSAGTQYETRFDGHIRNGVFLGTRKVNAE